ALMGDLILKFCHSSRGIWSLLGKNEHRSGGHYSICSDHAFSEQSMRWHSIRSCRFPRRNLSTTAIGASAGFTAGRVVGEVARKICDPGGVGTLVDVKAGLGKAHLRSR